MDYTHVYRAIHDFTLALRAVCRTLDTSDAAKAFKRLTPDKKKQFMELARFGNVHGLRDLIHLTLAYEDITLLSYQRLRERASQLRIQGFNKMHKTDLIRHIQVTEEVLRDKLKSMPKPKIGFIAGDGI
jgi:hypothetical protein